MSGLRVARGRPGGTCPGSSARDQSAKRCFTMRSSSEWYASTSTRPSGLEQVHRLVEAAARFGSSRLTSMRIAWNVRRAGWPPRRRAGAGMPRFTASTSSPVVAQRAGGDDLGRDAARRSAPRRCGR